MARDVAESSIHMEKEIGRGDDPEFLLNQASRIQDLHFKNGRRSGVIKNPEMFIKYEYKNPI